MDFYFLAKEYQSVHLFERRINMSDTYYVKTFGGLEITNDNVTVNIVELF